MRQKYFQVFISYKFIDMCNILFLSSSGNLCPLLGVFSSLKQSVLPRLAWPLLCRHQEPRVDLSSFSISPSCDHDHVHPKTASSASLAMLSISSSDTTILLGLFFRLKWQILCLIKLANCWAILLVMLFDCLPLARATVREQLMEWEVTPLM